MEHKLLLPIYDEWRRFCVESRIILLIIIVLWQKSRIRPIKWRQMWIKTFKFRQSKRTSLSSSSTNIVLMGWWLLSQQIKPIEMHARSSKLKGIVNAALAYSRLILLDSRKLDYPQLVFFVEEWRFLGFQFIFISDVHNFKLLVQIFD